jgi:hypothetical protein
MLSQEAEIEAIPVGCFTRLGKIFSGDVALHHQFSITTQRWFKVPVFNETQKCSLQSRTQTILFENGESDTICRNTIRYLEVRRRLFRVKGKAAKVDNY